MCAPLMTIYATKMQWMQQCVATIHTVMQTLTVARENTANQAVLQVIFSMQSTFTSKYKHTHALAVRTKQNCNAVVSPLTDIMLSV
jgi:hypothetical protein